MNTTPAPWTLTIGDHDASIHAGVTIATVTDEATNWRANAALIVQAPALLAALNRLTVACGEADALQHAGLVVPAKVWSEIYNANIEARAAIYKTEGK